ncbi:MAG: hypothetical protein ACLUB2_06595 [Butyricicoccus pullicaecorum]
MDALKAFYEVYNKHTSYKNEEGKLFGNWWNWEIGMPTKITSILALMQKDVQAADANLIANYIKAFDNHLRNGKNGNVDLTSATHTGTNLIDITANRMVQGALLGDTKRIEKAVSDMMTVFNTIDPYHIVNNNTDGVYADGSFISIIALRILVRMASCSCKGSILAVRTQGNAVAAAGQGFDH